MGTTERVVADASRRHDFKSVKIGRSVRIPKASLLAWYARKLADLPDPAPATRETSAGGGPEEHDFSMGRSRQAAARARNADAA